MFKKGNCLGVSINPHIDLPAAQLHAVHHPAGALGHFRGLKLHHTTAFGLPVLHLDVSI